jgi:methanol--5-hydroxybenzimidazolylcobamide Co-methyltransferase
MEQLIYDCRLMNRALAEGKTAALTLRRWLVESDAGLDPQAWVLTPDSVLAIARAIVNAPDHYQAGVAAARCAVDLLRAGHAAGRLKIAQRELGFLDSMAAQLDKLPADEAAFIAQQMALADPTKYLPVEYGLQGL